MFIKTMFKFILRVHSSVGVQRIVSLSASSWPFTWVILTKYIHDDFAVARILPRRKLRTQRPWTYPSLSIHYAGPLTVSLKR